MGRSAGEVPGALEPALERWRVLHIIFGRFFECVFVRFLRSERELPAELFLQTGDGSEALVEGCGSGVVVVDKLVPDFLWTTYESCATDTLRAMRKNKRRVVPGPISKAMDVISTYAPRGSLAPLLGSFYAKMGEEQHV